MQVLYMAFYLQYYIGYHKHNGVQRILLHLLLCAQSVIFLCFPSPQFLCRHRRLPDSMASCIQEADVCCQYPT